MIETKVKVKQAVSIPLDTACLTHFFKICSIVLNSSIFMCAKQFLAFL